MGEATWNRDRYARKITAKLSGNSNPQLEKSELDYIRAEVPCRQCGADMADPCVTLTGSNRKHVHSVHVDRLLEFMHRYAGDLYELETLRRRLSHAIHLIQQLRRRTRTISALSVRGEKAAQQDWIELSDAANVVDLPAQVLGRLAEQGQLKFRRTDGQLYFLRTDISELIGRQIEELRSTADSV
jgi:hypothetical protein